MMVFICYWMLKNRERLDMRGDTIRWGCFELLFEAVLVIGLMLAFGRF